MFSPDRPWMQPAAPLAAGLLQLLHGSCSFSALGLEHLHQALAGPHSCLFTTWHAMFPAVVHFFRRLDGVLMVSRSQDGEWASRIVHRLGYRTVRGSSHRGGSQALRAMLRLARRGHHAGLIADGSKGPARVAQPGIVWLARATQRPLFPVAMAAHPCWRLSSWDRTIIARPFSKVVMAFGEPLYVPRSASHESLELYRIQLEDTLNSLAEQADVAARRAGGVPVCSHAIQAAWQVQPRPMDKK
ncbi:lysophospholipid acyltransferase family protein [Desulfacinum hydrothermale]|nr:lysophospholipid acyltransferase family protein [Desulfacinum hydrothermale]